MKLEYPLIASGGVHIGQSFFNSYQVSWPSGTIELTNDNLIIGARFIPDFLMNMLSANWGIDLKRVEFEYNEIDSYKACNLLLLGHSITLTHSKPSCPSFVQMWVTGRTAHKITSRFNEKGVIEKR